MSVAPLDCRQWKDTVLRTARVCDARDGWVTLDDASEARVAVSCFIQPQAGDWVCCLEAESSYVLHVLRRPEGERYACVALPGIDRLRLCTRELELTATRKLRLASLVDCELLASTGRLTLTAQNIVSQATDSLFQIARELVSRAENIQQQARHLLCSRARRQLIVAEKEVRVDGELIQMG
ncbi:MAG TPA: DUF3540 domain-containing protein [Polyangiaceae bacterium]|jgi:hypothetical protein|nr:DUF3540 domain-containing protein [Polyangiaceae bacterium]